MWGISDNIGLKLINKGPPLVIILILLLKEKCYG